MNLRWIRGILNNTSLRKKLVLSYMLIIFIPMVISNSYLFSKLNESIIQYKNSTIRNSIEQVSQNINTKLNLYRQISDLLYLNQDINNLIYTDYRSSYDVYEAYKNLENLFGIISSTNRDVLKINLYSSNQSMTADQVTVIAIDDNIKATEWYQAALKERGRGYYSKLFTDKDANGNQVMHFYFVRTLDFWINEGTPSMLSIDINEKHLYSMIEQEARDKTIYIVNDNGDVVSSSDRASLSKDIRTIVDTSRMTQENGAYYESLNGIQYLVVYNTNPNNWTVVAMISLNNLFGIPRELLTLYLLLSSISLVVSVLLILAFSRLLTRRLMIFEQNVREIETDSLDIPMQISGNDEVGRLAVSFDHMLERIKRYLQEIKDNELKLRNSEIRTLQAQINPHFLYNTLNTINWLVLTDKKQKAINMLTELSYFYKSILSKGDPKTTIESEIDIVRNYLAIEKEKLDVELEERYEISDSCLKYKIVKFLLQPFVENTLNHAIGFNAKKLTITLRIIDQGDYVHIEIIDDGVGMNSDKLEEIKKEKGDSSGYAIYNVRERLKLYYHNEFILDIISRVGEGTEIHITIPKQ